MVVEWGVMGRKRESGNTRGRDKPITKAQAKGQAPEIGIKKGEADGGGWRMPRGVRKVTSLQGYRGMRGNGVGCEGMGGASAIYRKLFLAGIFRMVFGKLAVTFCSLSTTGMVIRFQTERSFVMPKQDKSL